VFVKSKLKVLMPNQVQLQVILALVTSVKTCIVSRFDPFQEVGNPQNLVERQPAVLPHVRSVAVATQIWQDVLLFDT
jgi:hypothetical protein